MMLSLSLLLHLTQLLQTALSVGAEPASTKVLLFVSKGKDGRGDHVSWEWKWVRDWTFNCFEPEHLRLWPQT